MSHNLPISHNPEDLDTSKRSSAAPTLRGLDPVTTRLDNASAVVKKELRHKVDVAEPTDLIVSWDGPDDPENPKNWSIRRKWMATVMVASFTFISPLSSSMIAPASRNLAKEFRITSDIIVALTTSIFVLAYAIGPLLLGPLSEIYGRSCVLQLANLWYLAWNLGCGFAQNKAQLIAFRFLAGLGGSAPLSIGGGVLGDCWAAEQRGKAIVIYSLAPLIGPIVGPICGAWIAEKTTWRWVFWSTTIVDGIIQCFGYFLLDESYAPVLLERKLSRTLKSQDAEKGIHQQMRTPFQSEDRHWKRILANALTRPFVMFVREPIIQLLGLYLAFVYGLFYLFLTTIPGIFQGVYDERPGIAGLHYIALGIGLGSASQLNARMLDWVYSYYKNKNGGKGRPEFRLPSTIPGTFCIPIGLLITGWTVQHKVFWLAPDIGIALVGAGTLLNFQSVQSYVIDAFTLHAASALAAVSCLRSIAGFGFPLFAPAMYKFLGYGKGNTILAGVAIGIGCPAPWIFWKYGEQIRKSSRYSEEPTD